MLITQGLYDKEFKFQNKDKEETILIKPLPSKYLKDLFTVVNIMNSIPQELSEAERTQKMLSLLSEDTVITPLMTIVSETIKKAYPDMPLNLVDEFVAVNAFKILPFIVEVNFPR